jgi:glycosyltransferase involved in cell wall biosynthesis
MKILYVAYPLQPVTPESSGGAEQVLLMLERAMHARGHETVITGCESSTPSGELLVTGPAGGAPDQFEPRLAQHIRAVIDYARAQDLDLIHDHSHWFWPHAGEVGVPVLATLHLPRSFYPADAFTNIPANVSFNCVSASQAEDFQDVNPAIIENGVDLSLYTPGTRKSNHLLWLGRICEEKAPHLAIAAARVANARLVIAGSVYPFSYHQHYFEREVAPHLHGEQIKFVPTPSFEQKLQLLCEARAVLITSQCRETSSLVAMEALACGTPVIAFRTGALPSIIRHGETGFVVDSAEEMAQAISSANTITPKTCRVEAERQFSSLGICDAYEQLYEHFVGVRTTLSVRSA